MQSGFHRLVPFRLGPALSGLVFAALVPVGPALAGEVGAGAPAVPWLGLPADGGEAGVWQSPTEFRGLAGFEFFLREADEGMFSRGLFFRAGDGLRIGAQGSLDLDSGDLSAIFALKLDF